MQKFNAVVQKNVEQEATISLLHEKNFSLREQVNKLSMIVARRSQQLATTPEGGRSNPNKRQRVIVSTDVSSFNLEVNTATGASETSRSGSPAPPPAALPNTAAVPTTNTTAPTTTALTNPVVAPAPALSPTVTTAAAPPPAPPQRVPPLPLRHGHRAEQVSMGKKSMKNNEFCYHLVLLAKKGVFRQHPKLAKGSTPPWL